MISITILKKGWENSRKIFIKLNEKITSIDSRIITVFKKYHIAYKLGQYNFIDIHPYMSGPSINFLRTKPENLNDPKKKVQYDKNSYARFHQHISLYQITNENEINYAIDLIKQAYKRYISLKLERIK